MGTLRERLVNSCIDKLQEVRGLPELEDGDSGDDELFGSESARTSCLILIIYVTCLCPNA